jgi:hypothetical protein
MPETIGYGSDGPVFSTDKFIPGDPSAAKHVANTWLAAYPIGYFYYTHLDALTFPLTGFPNIDYILFRICFPLFILVVIFFSVDVIRKSSFFIFRGLIFCWKILVLFASINLIGWILVLFIPWFFKLAIDLVSWLFQR